MKIGDLARVTGLSTHTIRYYEQIGLLPRAARNASGHRDYDPDILAWIEFLGRLKTTGMPLRQMRRYAELRLQGHASERERRDMLVDHRDGVRARVGALQAALQALDDKIAGYSGADKETER